jgi:hypothetical protein
MTKTYRIRTTPGEDKNIRINVNQDFDFLEILSLKLRQDDVYTRFCADYGVIAGRVITNGGYGIPNANVSVFVPLTTEDENDPVISTLYPYKTVDQKNEDGYRYNLLPYRQDYQGHTPTGTFPDREDVLTRREVLEVYEKYYKYTVKTNESGDFMIIGVPLGQQVVMLDLDLSNIGCFSLSPSDLISLGRGGSGQFNGNRFKSSTDLDSLPQIVNQKKEVSVTSFWGETELCEVGITRVDFDLRDLGIEIKPHAIFMGSIFSNADEDFLKTNCKPKKDTGNLCDLVSSEGRILAIRQTIAYDSDGRPVLEQFSLPDNGKVIDENGTWLTEVPMNLDYVITNEFGEQVLSNDPSVGIPTKGKYRFRIQYQNENGINNQILRADYLIPNIKEWGWSLSNQNSPTDLNAQKYSYAFSLDWVDYGDLTTTLGSQMIQEAINCEDKFYEFNFNKVYTITSFIDRWKWGSNRSRHLGIKEITDRRCTTTNNRFPVNDGVRNFDFLFFLFNMLITLLTPILYQLIIIAHVLAFIWPLLKLIIDLLIWLINVVIYGICKAISALSGGNKPKGGCNKKTIKPLPDENPFKRIALPMMSFPDCEACPCEETTIPPSTNQTSESLSTTIESENNILLGDINTIDSYNYSPPVNSSDPQATYEGIRQVLAGYPSGQFIKTPITEFPSVGGQKRLGYDVTLTQSMNLANLRQRYFDGENRIRTTINNSTPSQPFEDSVLVIFADPGTLNAFTSGDLISFTNPASITDPNLNVLTGTTQTSTNLVPKQVTWIDVNGLPQTSNIYIRVTGDTSTYKYTAGIEYFQVITGGTVSEYQTLLAPSGGLLNKYLFKKKQKFDFGLPTTSTYDVYPLQQIINYQTYEIIFLTRGVDPYTEKQTIKYDLSPLFGKTFGNGLIVEGEYYLNIPIRSNSGSGVWFNDQKTPQTHNITTNNLQSNLYNEPFGFNVNQTMFSAFTNNSPHYYNSTDKTQSTFKAYNTDTFTLGVFTSPDGVLSDTTFVGTLNTGPNTITFDQTNNILTQGNIEGGSLMASNTQQGSILNNSDFVRTFSPAYHNQSPSNIQINNSQLLVFRSDRLPTSDSTEIDGNNSFSLHLNSNFTYYTIQGVNDLNIPNNISNSTDSNGNSQDSQGDTPSQTSDVVLATLTCENMTLLDCYDGSGTNFTVLSPCDANPDGKRMKGGCYYLVDDPLIVSIIKDIKLLTEWKSRFRLVFGACRGIFSHVFQNNWVNGTLYMFAFKKQTIFDIVGQPKKYLFCGSYDSTYRPGQGPIYYTEGTTNSFFYRATPYDGTNFIGQIPKRATFGDPTLQPAGYGGMNERNIFFPTTVMDLGPKDEFTKEICTNPNFEGYYVDTLLSTSFKDTSDLLSLFFISRMINSNFWGQALGLGDASINKMFSRSEQRIDGDLAQLFSINSEYGVEGFDDDTYDDNDLYISNNSDIVMGVFFTSNTIDRKVVSPGVLTFNSSLSYTFGYPKTQEVPFYKWNLAGGNTIFGLDTNDWATNISNGGFYSQKYQDLSFDNSPISPYFNDTNGGRRGYIFNSSNGINNPQFPSGTQNSFIVGAPYHFYFGLNKGKSTINRYITKYILNQDE